MTPDVLTDATADLAMALLLAAARHLPEARDDARAGRWRTWEPQAWLGLELRGARLAIVGAGRIGRAVAARADGFGMDVELVGRDDDLLTRSSRRADVVSLHAPLTTATRHLIDAEALAAMRPARSSSTPRAAASSTRPRCSRLHAAHRRRGARRHRPRAAAARRPAPGCSERARRPAHRLGHARGARAHDRRSPSTTCWPASPASRSPTPPAECASRSSTSARTRRACSSPTSTAATRPSSNAASTVTRLGRGRRPDRPPLRRGDERVDRRARRLPQADRRAPRRDDDRPAHQRGPRRRQRRRLPRARARASTASTRASCTATRRRG